MLLCTGERSEPDVLHNRGSTVPVVGVRRGRCGCRGYNELHAHSGSEPRFALIEDDESGAAVEAVGVRVRRHFDPRDAREPRGLDQISHQASGDSPAHPIWVHKQVHDLQHRAVGGKGGDEADGRAVGCDRDARPAVGHSAVGPLQCVRMRQQDISVPGVGQRRSSKDAPERRPVSRKSATNVDCRHLGLAPRSDAGLPTQRAVARN
jgi:hypothetical protein